MRRTFITLTALFAFPTFVVSQEADLILHHGQIITVDEKFSIVEAMAIKGDRILALGEDEDVLKHSGPKTKVVDLDNKTVLPGLMDSHTHPTAASMYEFDHNVPEMETIADVLGYVASRAKVLEPGKWISIRQVFITRLRDQRYPTRQELDKVAPNHPVVFSTGPDASVNSLALKLSGIDDDFKITDGQPGYLERDPATGKLNGILRSCTRLVKSQSSEKSSTAQDKSDRLKALLRDYNAVGITSIADRNAGDDAIELFQKLKDSGELTCRVFLNYAINAQDPLEKIEERIKKAAASPQHKYDNMLWLRGVKVFLDGGMLTGSAYMREPWGVSSIYSITDPAYKGLQYIPADRLAAISRLALMNDLQMTAHSQGDGAVHALIDAYEAVNREFPVKDKRPCITHSSFMSLEAIQKMREIGIVADLQPAWLWLDGATLAKQFGESRLEFFHPYKTCFDLGVPVGGGSDHMQKIGSYRSVNPYNPFLGIWITLSRVPKGAMRPLHPEQTITREQAIRLYTINNAYLMFAEKEKGSLEKGKLADFVIIQDDILGCPLEKVKTIEVVQTYLGGKVVYDTKQ